MKIPLMVNTTVNFRKLVWKTKVQACLKAETLAMVGGGDMFEVSTVRLRNKTERRGGP